MAGTDASRRRSSEERGPAVVLVEPQLGENIGMAARAMLNCGLVDLRLVRPREPWPNDKAVAAASGADRVLDKARLYPTTAAAISDLTLVLATTARDRDMTKRFLTPRRAAGELRKHLAAGGAAGVLFGRESRGLDNDDIALADAAVAARLNPGFQSLNLGTAVFMIGYEWFQAEDTTPADLLMMPKRGRPAARAELTGLFEHLERELDDCGFLRLKDKRAIMVRNLRNMLGRAGLTLQEVRTMHGVIDCLVTRRHRRDPS
jgi:tRNA/rRNA methyltransferase